MRGKPWDARLAAHLDGHSLLAIRHIRHADPNVLGTGEPPQALEPPHMADDRVPRLVGNRLVTGPFPQPRSPQGRNN